jgi:arsenate reductase
MAEGFARALKSDIIEPYSAGLTAKGIDPRAVKVMNEIGVDISGQRSKTVLELGTLDFDYVVTVCDNARESCPFFPGNVKRVHVSFEDPPHLAEGIDDEEEALTHYRRVRDQIKEFVMKIPEILDKKNKLVK